MRRLTFVFRIFPDGLAKTYIRDPCICSMDSPHSCLLMSISVPIQTKVSRIRSTWNGKSSTGKSNRRFCVKRIRDVPVC